MDRSLDEIIAERPQKQNRGRRPPQGQGRRRDGVKKVLPPLLLSNLPIAT